LVGTCGVGALAAARWCPSALGGLEQRQIGFGCSPWWSRAAFLRGFGCRQVEGLCSRGSPLFPILLSFVRGAGPDAICVCTATRHPSEGVLATRRCSPSSPGLVELHERRRATRPRAPSPAVAWAIVGRRRSGSPEAASRLGLLRWTMASLGAEQAQSNPAHACSWSKRAPEPGPPSQVVVAQIYILPHPWQHAWPGQMRCAGAEQPGTLQLHLITRGVGTWPWLRLPGGPR